MLAHDKLDELYATGYHKIPPLMVDGKPAFSTVAHRRGLSELAWVAEVTALLDAATLATKEKNVAVAQWLQDRANLMIMERDELALENPPLN